MPSKTDLRRHFRRQRQSLPPAQRQRAEKRINNLLKGYLKRGKGRLVKIRRTDKLEGRLQ